MLLLGLVPIATLPTARADDTFTAYWAGQPFQEQTNALARFTHWPLTANANGFANITPLPTVPDGTPTHGNFVGVTNLAIQAQMLLFGIQTSDVIAQIDLLLGSNASYTTARVNAENSIRAGDFRAALPSLQNTPAAVTFYCGDTSLTWPIAYQWYIGVPNIVDCNFDGSRDLVMVAAATGVRQSFGTITGADLTLQSRPYNTGFTSSSWIGWGYNTIALGAITYPQNIQQTTASLDGLNSNDVYGSVTIGTQSGSFAPGDKLWITTGYPSLDTTIYVLLSQPTSSFTVRPDIYWNTCSGVLCSLRATIDLDTTFPIDQLNLHLPLSDKRLELAAFAIPLHFQIRWDKNTVYTNGFAHVTNLHVIQLDTPSPQLNLEIKASIYNPDNSNEYNFQLKGFPSHAVLKYDPGWHEGSCGDDDSVTAIDLSKELTQVSGRFRALSFDGIACDIALQLTGADFERARIMSGRHSPWGGPKFVEVATTAYVMSDSKLELFAKTPQWYLPNFDGYVSNSPAGVVRDWDLVSGCVLTPCLGYFNDGDYAIPAQFTVFTPIFWAIGSGELSLNTCKPTDMVFAYGLCP